MAAAQDWTDEISVPSPDELVSFSVICQPRGGQSYEELLRGLTLSNLETWLPTEQARAGVVAK